MCPIAAAGRFSRHSPRAAIVNRLAAATEQALSDSTINQRFEEMGTPAMRGYTPERFAAYVRDEIAFWEPEVRGLGIKAE